MPASAFERRILLHQHPVHKYREGTGIDFIVPIEKWAAENDVTHLPRPGRMEGIGHRRIHAVDGTGKTIGICRVVVIVQHLHFHQSHRKNPTVTATLAATLDLGGS